MTEVSYLEAWTLWLSGNQVQDSLLWGVKILWWGRIGKLIQFMAALTIIAEIIGPDRLRLFGNSMHGAFTLNKAKFYLRDALNWIKAVGRYIWTSLILLKSPIKFFKGSKEIAAAINVTQTFKADNLNFLVCLALTVTGVYWAWPHMTWWQIPIVLVGWYCSLLVTLSPIVTILLLFVFAFGGLLLDSLLIEPLAWMIERRHIEKWVKIISVLLLLVGFHFDLLSS
jgi:hypothetical protein